MTIFYIKLDTEKKSVQIKRGFFGVWWYDGIYSLYLLGKDGWPRVDWWLQSVTRKRDGSDRIHIEDPCIKSEVEK